LAAVGLISTESSDAWRNALFVAEFYALATLAFAKEV
jgi:hypothetical protein